MQIPIGINHMNSYKNELDYIFVDKNRYPFSTSPEHCDFLSNGLVVEQIIGTLIKLNWTGRYENYLASHRDFSDDGRIWNFYIIPNLTTEKGENITAYSYKLNLERLFNIYLKETSSLLSFDDLEGMNEFKKHRGSISGIIAPSKYHLRFIFKRRPLDLIEDLSIPQFGYYSDSDFQNGEWINNKQITSSGPYKLFSWNEDEIVLKKRNNWFGMEKKSADIVHIKMGLNHISDTRNNYTIIQKNIESEIDIIDNYAFLKSTPVRLSYIVLTPSLLFKDINTRRWFQNKLSEAKKIIPFQSLKTFNNDTFFLNLKNIHKISPSNHTDETKLFDNKKIKIALSIDGDMEKSHIKKIIGYIFKNTNALIEYFDFSNIRNMKDFLSNKHFDIRVGGVATGGEIDPVNVKMMFCSSLGVNFPDPNHTICSLLNDYHNELIPIDQLSNSIEKIISDEAIVLPLSYSSMTWLYSDNIKGISQTSPVMDLPRFDVINLEN